MNNPNVELGLQANWQQFSLLVLVNAFVGAMVGLERTLVPQIAAEEFQLASVSVALSFIISFGIVKALTNLLAGRNADRWGRKPLLLLGWLMGLPVPILVIMAPRWEWIVFANVLLGINQGLCWSTAVIMKIDLVGITQRGLAMGLNEFAGYVAMALSTISSGWIAAQTALRPYPFLMGVAFVLLGSSISLFFVRETLGHMQYEAARHKATRPPLNFGRIFRQVSWQDKSFFSLSQGGLVNNLNDVVIWGLLPLLALQTGIEVEQVATIGGTYLATWGISQLFMGLWSDRIGRKPLISGGLLVQSLGIFLFVVLSNYAGWIAAALIMGLGTGMVYPTLLAAVSDLADPLWRASAVGVYRLWRDSGYAFGALVGGILADVFSLQMAVTVIALLTLCSSLLTAALLPETLPQQSEPIRESTWKPT
jgi:MFS family permease